MRLRLSARRWLPAAAGLVLAAGLLLFWTHASPQHPSLPGSDRPPAGNASGALPALSFVRTQLALPPVLTAEEALRHHPADRSLRLHLAQACDASGDPVGAALALYPLVAPHESAPASGTQTHAAARADPALLAQYARYCLQVGWLEETAMALCRLPAPPRRAILDLAAAWAEHGQAGRAIALLSALAPEKPNAGEWLDGAITWYHCRRLPEAVQWARRAVASSQPDTALAARAVLARCLLASHQPEAALTALSPVTPLGLHDRVLHRQSRDRFIGKGSRTSQPLFGVREHAPAFSPAGDYGNGWISLASWPRLIDHPATRRWRRQSGSALPHSTIGLALTQTSVYGSLSRLPLNYPEGHDPIRSSSSNPLLDEWRARAMARGSDAAQRRTAGEQLARLATATGDPATTFEAGRSLVLSGEPGRAVPLLSRAAVSRYQEPLCYELLGQAYTALGRPAEALWARARARTAWGQFGEATALLKRSVALDPSRPMAFVDLARALDADGKTEEALAVLVHAQRVTPGNMDVSLLKAKLLLHLERVPEVIRELTNAAALDPKRANEPLGNLGTVYYDSQQFDRAIPVLERAVQLEDGDAHSHFYLGRTYARKPEEPAQAEKAVEHLLRAAELEPDYSRPWMAAAAVLQRMGAVPEAAACLRRAIAGECQSDAPYVRLAALLQMEGRLPERELILRQYAAIRDHDLTRTGLEKETRDHPRDAARRFQLGDLLFREGHPDKALPELLAAAGMRPTWSPAWSRLADACAVLGFDDLREEAERDAVR